MAEVFPCGSGKIRWDDRDTEGQAAQTVSVDTGKEQPEQQQEKGCLDHRVTGNRRRIVHGGAAYMAAWDTDEYSRLEN